MSEETAAGKKLVVIDGKSVFYRGYYAMPNLGTKDGTPTGGVFGFATMALEVIRRLKPDYVAVAWDKPKTNIRKRLEMYPEYKAGRKPAPEDFKLQIPVLQELLEAFGWPLYELDDYEADDIMGTLAVQAEKQGLETLLVTSDMDMLQLINEHVHVYALKTGLSNIELYSPKSFEAKYGISVDQFLDLKSIKGDSSDNIPGVPGVGEKGALDLLKTYDTLDGVYENLALIKESQRKKLEAGKDLAYLSKELARIWTDAPIKLDLKEVDGSKADPTKIQYLLQKLEFRTLAKQLPEIMQVPVSVAKKDVKSNGLKPQALKALTEPGQLSEFKAKNEYYAVAHYTDVSHREIKLLGIASDTDEGFIVTAEQLADKDFQRVLQNNAATYYDNVCVGYDVKALLKQYAERGINYHSHSLFDVQIAAFMINPLSRDQSLPGLCDEYLELDITAENLDEQDQLRIEIAALQKLHEHLDEIFKKPENKKLYKLFFEVEMMLLPVLAEMESVGIKLDVSFLKNFAEEINDLISDYEQQIYGHADQEFNIGSPAQLSEILFNKLKLPTQGVKKGRTGYSTAARELDKLRGLHPIIDLITQYREVTKLKNTYVDTLPEQVDKNSRLHTSFDLTTAQTGRLSSRDPNLQNIPIRTELGRRIRTAFVADKGKKLVSADYSQFELRLAAALADEKEIIDAFNKDADVHTITAAQVYGRDPEDVTKQMRRAAKAVNFGIMYGQGPHALAEGTGMDFKSAKNFIDKYFEIRPKIKEFIQSTRKLAEEQGYVETLLGRRRPTPDVKSSNFILREAALRAAVNMPLQGTAADIMKIAMIAVDAKLKEKYPDSQMLLQIHDSVLIECPAAQAEELAATVKDVMENVYKLPVKLTVDTSVGDNWGEL